jgi:hypothetical protein
MSESLEECLARAAACRAAAASEALDSVRRVHLKAAASWEMLGERARWVAPSRDLPAHSQSSFAGDGAALSCRLEAEGDLIQVNVSAEQPDIGRKSHNADDNSEIRIPPCERASVVLAEDGILEFKLLPDPAACNGEDAQQTCTVVLYAADGHLRKLRQIETDLIRLAIQLYGGRMVEVARRLGIGRSTLYRKMSESGLIQQDATNGQKTAQAPLTQVRNGSVT